MAPHRGQPAAGLLQWALLAASAPAAVGQGQSPTGWGSIDILRTCVSDVGPMHVKAWSHKGLTVEDTTLKFCTDKVPEVWPNTLAPVRSLRLFRAWHAKWKPEEDPKLQDKWESWRHLRDFAVSNGAKILLGTQVTCRRNADDWSDAIDFDFVKDLAKFLGPEHIFGLAVGNELDLLYTKMKDDSSVSDACIRDMWSGGYWREFQERVEAFDALGENFSQVPVTAVFSAAALGGWPFQEQPGKALVTSFLRNASEKYGKSRFVFTFNHYSYFDDNLKLDPGSYGNCTRALGVADCWDRRCMPPRSMADARRKIYNLTGETDYRYWVGETGWSYPRPDTLGTHMAACSAWSDMPAFERFYRGFLDWDMSIPGERPPDHVFYFSVRTSMNFGKPEYFGLIDQCSNTTCKIKSNIYAEPMTEMLEQEKVLAMWRARGFAVTGSLILASLLGSLVYVTVLPSTWKGRGEARKLMGLESAESPSSSSEESE